jgi:CheY-like chemotaxis protein
MKTLHPKLVLVVFTDDLVRRALCAALRDAGYAVHDTPRLAVALRWLRNGHADALLVDPWQRGRDWDELLRRLDEDEQMRALPVTIISTGSLPGAPGGTRRVVQLFSPADELLSDLAGDCA